MPVVTDKWTGLSDAKIQKVFELKTLIVPNHVDSNNETTTNNIEIDKILIKSETV